MTTAPVAAFTLDAAITLALAQASIAAYAAFGKVDYQSPAHFQLVDSWTGWDAILAGGVEDLYGLVFQSTLPGESGIYIFAYRGTDSDMDIYEDALFEIVHFVPSRGGISPVPRVASGFYGVYDLLGGSMTRSMRGQLFASRSMCATSGSCTSFPFTPSSTCRRCRHTRCSSNRRCGSARSPTTCSRI